MSESRSDRASLRRVWQTHETDEAYQRDSGVFEFCAVADIETPDLPNFVAFFFNLGSACTYRKNSLPRMNLSIVSLWTI